MRQRYIDLIVSIYLYNEYRGYIQLDRLLEMLEAEDAYPEVREAIRSHAADERKHYRMFVGYFRNRRTAAYRVGRWVGYFDLLAHLFTGKPTDEWGRELLNPKHFAKLCRAVAVTERRGIRQVQWMLNWKSIRQDRRLYEVFTVVEEDEPSHFLPYEAWLKNRGFAPPGWGAAIVDVVLHYGIGLMVLPLCYFNPWLSRLDRYPHEGEAVSCTAGNLVQQN